MRPISDQEYNRFVRLTDTEKLEFLHDYFLMELELVSVPMIIDNFEFDLSEINEILNDEYGDAIIFMDDFVINAGKDTNMMRNKMNRLFDDGYILSKIKEDYPIPKSDLAASLVDFYRIVSEPIQPICIN